MTRAVRNVALALMLLGGRAAQALVRIPDYAWKVWASSERAGYEAANVLSKDLDTYWHTAYVDDDLTHPYSLYIDMGSSQVITELAYLPTLQGTHPQRWAGTEPNGRIGEFEVLVAEAGASEYTKVASGTWADSPAVKTAWFEPVSARYVQLVAKSEAGDRGPWASAGGIMLHGPQPEALKTLVAQGATQPASLEDASSAGSWTDIGELPLVAVAAAMLPNGKVLTWSAYDTDTFKRGTQESFGYTQTALWDPEDPGAATLLQVSKTDHDMFCPGIALLPDGNVHVAGGSDEYATTVYDWQADEWLKAQRMNVPRGYQGNCPLPDGRVFTLGGSFSGGEGGKNAEIWAFGSGWENMPTIPAEPFLTEDPEGVYRADNHLWLFPVSQNLIFHAGPSRAMHWIDVSGQGSYSEAGIRSNVDQMNGNAVMYDAYKILTVGGCPSYELGPTETSPPPQGTSVAHIIELKGRSAEVREVQRMAYPRTFACSTVLPDGTVLVTGGQQYPRLFTDQAAIMPLELFDPKTETWTVLAALTEPRTYHSIALLLPDARVFVAGGGLCSPRTYCVNHFDYQVYTPPYLIAPDGSLAPRITIVEAPAEAAVGATILVETSSAASYFALVRLGATTHTVNNDSRRIVLKHTAAGSAAQLDMPGNAWLALPGYWYLFAVDAQGVPSVAHLLQVTL